MYMMLYYNFNFLLIMISYKICRFFFVGISKKNKIFFLCNPVELDSYFVNVVESLLLFPIQVKKWITLVCVVQLRLIIHKIWSLNKTLSAQNRAVFFSITLFKPKLEKVRYIYKVYIPRTSKSMSKFVENV